jgi:riboflavin transporter FmnP
MKKFDIRFITRVAIFGAVSSLLYMFIKFSVPLIPSFLEMNFSDVPAVIASFAFGPLTGVLVQVVKVLIKILFVSTSTSYVGELADVLLGIAFVLPAGLYYRNHRSFKGAIIGSFLTLVIHTTVACLLNYFYMIPFYITLFFKGDEQALLNLSQMVNPYITDVKGSMILWAIFPFNLFKNTINLLIAFLVYKRMRKLINQYAKEHELKKRNG